jgi:hypothetical protein
VGLAEFEAPGFMCPRPAAVESKPISKQLERFAERRNLGLDG